jgi:hypothetical protein
LRAGKDVIDPTTWAGSVPQAQGIAPRVRVGRTRWFNLLWLIPIGFLVLIAAVAAAQELRKLPSVERFIAAYPGTVHSPNARAQEGFPAWVGVQHFLNLFLMIFIIRSGIQILSDHPRLYWTRHSTPGKDWFRIQKPVPAEPLWTAKQDSISLPGQIGLPGLRHSIGLARCNAARLSSTVRANVRSAICRRFTPTPATTRTHLPRSASTPSKPTAAQPAQSAAPW